MFVRPDHLDSEKNSTYVKLFLAAARLMQISYSLQIYQCIREEGVRLVQEDVF